MTTLLLLSLFLSACVPLPTPPPNTGIEGQVFIGPMCPVVQVGVPCPDQPYQANITVLDQNGNRVTQFQTDSQGRFRVLLNQGAYVLRPVSPGAMPLAAE